MMFHTHSSLIVTRLALPDYPLPSRKWGKKGKSIPEGAQEGWQLWESCLSG